MSKPPRPAREHEHVLEQVAAMAALAPLLPEHLKAQLEDVQAQAAEATVNLANVGHFGRIYGPVGWTLCDAISTELVGRVLELDLEAGEAELTQAYLDPDHLHRLGWRFHKAALEPWRALYERGVERIAADDHISAAPLILIIIDGVCQARTGRHPFSGAGDIPVFDTLTSDPGGVADGFALLGSVRRKLSAEPLAAPYRHGILHGLDPNYGHPIVTAKAISLLEATLDYFDRKADEASRLAKAEADQAPVDVLDLAHRIARNAAITQAIEAWSPRPPRQELVASNDGASGLDPASPEAAAVRYLKHLTSRNWGGLAKATLDLMQRPTNMMAGRFRQELTGLTVDRWRVTDLFDTGCAASEMTVELSGRLGKKPWSGTLPLRAIRVDAALNSLPRGLEDGVWLIQPDFQSRLWLAALQAS